MDATDLRALAGRVAAGRGPDPALEAAAAQALAAAWPGAGIAPAGAAGWLVSTDAVLAAVARALPGWDVTIEGTASAPDGHWTCSLRRSRALDSDRCIGIGKDPSLPRALLAALISTAAQGPGD